MIKLEDIISKRGKYAIMKTLWPVLQSLGHMFDAEESRKEVSQKDWFKLSTNLEFGDVILSTTANNPGNFFLPGKVKHAAIVVSPDPQDPQLVEAVSSGVRQIPLYNFMKNKNYLVHCRSSIFSSEVSKKASSISIGMIGTPFDHVFSPSNNWLYCSEVIYESYKKAYFIVNSDIKPGSFPLKMKVRCDELTYIPDDIRIDSKNWDTLWSNAN